MFRTRLLAPVLVAAFAAVPAGAQDGRGDMGQGLDLMQQGGRLLLRGIIAQMEPPMRDLIGALVGMMDDINAYQLPEVLPNGDIIIRRKRPLVPRLPGEDGNDIEL